MTIPPRKPSSNQAAQLGTMIVLEGMPGSGKTTAATRLTDEGHQVVGEYTTSGGQVIEIADHPAVDDDQAHRANWLTKHQLVAAMPPLGTVFCDRDWLSALAYAASIDDRKLMRSRAAWACSHLRRGSLAIADHYILFPLDPATSLARRADRLTPGHPWSDLTCLHRLQVFYADPVRAIDPVTEELGHEMRAATWHHLPPGGTIEETVHYLRDLPTREGRHERV